MALQKNTEILLQCVRETETQIREFLKSIWFSHKAMSWLRLFHFSCVFKKRTTHMQMITGSCRHDSVSMQMLIFTPNPNIQVPAAHSGAVCLTCHLGCQHSAWVQGWDLLTLLAIHQPFPAGSRERLKHKCPASHLGGLWGYWLWLWPG